MSDDFKFTFEGTEQRGDWTITTEVEHGEYEELETPPGHMAGCVVVTVTHPKFGVIGEAWTSNWNDLGEQRGGILYKLPADPEELDIAITAARENALDAAREWLKAEIEAIQSGQRDAELFAAVTALNTATDPNADLKSAGYNVDTGDGWFYARNPEGRLISGADGLLPHLTADYAWLACRRDYDYNLILMTEDEVRALR